MEEEQGRVLLSKRLNGRCTGHLNVKEARVHNNEQARGANM